jgi:hypothetical protein
MFSEDELSVVGDLVLVRLLPAKEGSDTLAQVKKDLGVLVGERGTRVAWSELVARALDRLESDGLVSWIKRGRTERWALTAHGRRRGCEFLGIDSLPPKATWAAIKRTFLLARALDLPAPSGERLKRFSSDGGLRAALLKAHYALTVPDFPTPAQATDALAWKLIGFDTDQPFTKEAVLRALFQRELGDQQPAKSGESLKWIVARRVVVGSQKPAELRAASLRAWIDRLMPAATPSPSATVVAEPTPVSPSQPAAAAPYEFLSDGVPFALRSFAARVLSVARSSPTGRFGDAKVFIAHVWRALQFDPEFRELGPDGFKQRLTEANRARLLDLGRADLVEAMDPADVRDSETRYLGATFHFIRI